MSYFMQSGDAFRPTPGKDAVLENLPVGNYVVAESMTGLFYQRVESYQDEGRTYGNLDNRAERIMNTFLSRERATGVLLSGEKGSGKTRLARQLSRMGAEQGFPTILVNAPYFGDPFAAHLATVEQPAIVIMDEFEKVYDKQQQEMVLTLLDGTMTSKKLFILTVNDTWAVNSHMKNRPGRLFYNIEFTGLDADFIRDYCEDKLQDKDQIESVLLATSLFEQFNFDMLKALVEEMNRYNESAFQAMELLNTKPVASSFNTDTYKVTVVGPEGREVTMPEEHQHTPLSAPHGHGLGLYVRFDHNESNDPLERMLDEDGDVHLHIKPNDVRRIDADAGLYEFVTNGFTVRFTRNPKPTRDLRDLAWSQGAI